MSKKILFVDDEAHAREFVKMAAEAYGADFIVETAEGILDSINKLNSETYAALILDISLPGMNGSTFAPFVHKAFPRLPIAFLSNFDSESASEIANEVNAEYWSKIDKMADFETMQKCIENLIEGKNCDGTKVIVDLNAPEGTGKVELPQIFKELLDEGHPA